MALYIFEDPSTLFDQHFGLDLDPDLLLALSGCPAVRKNYSRLQRSAPQHASTLGRRDHGSKITRNSKNFHVSLDVQQFSPDEITVKAAGNEIVIEGKHDEKVDDCGSISRHFVRRYLLPEGHSADDVKSSLSSDGILNITAPRKQVPAGEERVVPITFTGSPHAAIEKESPPKAV